MLYKPFHTPYRLGETTGNALNGLLLLMVGAVLWIVASFAGAIGEVATGEANPGALGLMIIGFLVMIGGPVWYWIVTPIRSRRKKK